MLPIHFHGVYLDTDAVIGISPLQDEPNRSSVIARSYFFEVHFNGTKMRINIPKQPETDGDFDGRLATIKHGEEIRNELFLRVLHRGMLPSEAEPLST